MNTTKYLTNVQLSELFQIWIGYGVHIF